MFYIDFYCLTDLIGVFSHVHVSANLLNLTTDGSLSAIFQFEGTFLFLRPKSVHTSGLMPPQHRGTLTDFSCHETRSVSDHVNSNLIQERKNTLLVSKSFTGHRNTVMEMKLLGPAVHQKY